MITQQEVLEWFDYNPDTGLLYWKKKPARKILVGQVAGCKCDYKQTYYYNIRVLGKIYKAHRLVWLHQHGELPENMMIDHIDGNGLNNKLENLRLATPAQNQYNRKKQQKYPGTQKVGDKYIARLQHKRKSVYIGIFDTIEEAHQAYLDKARELRGEYVRQ